MEEQSTASQSAFIEQLACQLGIEAFIFGYPLVIMDVTRQVGTNVPRPSEHSAPMNQFGHMRTFPDDTFTTVVSPNADTLYSIAFLDLSHEPIILRLPEMGNRYYLMEMLDAWTNVFASPGTRATGNRAGDYAIVGPGWRGILPEDLHKILSPTNLVWIIGRTQTNGKNDYPAVHAIQNQYKLTPLHAWGSTYRPPNNVPVSNNVDMTRPPAEQVAEMDVVSFFDRLNDLMRNNPAGRADSVIQRGLATLGIIPGEGFKLAGLNESLAKGFEAGFWIGHEKIVDEAKNSHGKTINGWEFTDNLGQYGTDYLWRAVVAMIGLGANLPEDAIYPRATRDARGEPLDGKNHYTIRFAKGQLPPVAAFWSITMYNSQHFFVKNPLNRYAISDRDKLHFAENGSLTLYVQNDSPGAHLASNWLPAPEGSFNLIMRLYWPNKEIISGSWEPPRVERVAAEARKAA